MIFNIVITPLNADQQDVLMAQIMDEYEVEGFEQGENELKVYSKTVLSELENLAAQMDATIKINELEDQNWNAVWESNFDPVIVDEFCGVRAHFHAPILNVAHELLITPKMSFGTGHHATTFQMIQAMRAIDFNGATVCDYGTGTGVLAILAEKLGATNIAAIDNDEWSVDNTKENCLNNNCTKVEIALGTTIDLAIRYDVILANINKNVLLHEMSNLATALKANGILLLSGVLRDDLADMEESLIGNNLKINAVNEKNGWLCIAVSKN